MEIQHLMKAFYNLIDWLYSSIRLSDNWKFRKK